jgi:hypothetical protein
MRQAPGFAVRKTPPGSGLAPVTGVLDSPTDRNVTRPPVGEIMVG